MLILRFFYALGMVFILSAPVILPSSLEAQDQNQIIQNLIARFKSEGKSASEVLNELKGQGVTIQDLRNAGYTVEDFKNSGITAEELKNSGVTLQELKDAGYTAADLRDAGFTANDLRQAGFTVAELQAAGFSNQDLADAGLSLAELRAAGASITELRQAGYTASQLRAEGVTARELLLGGFSATDLRSAGYSLAEIKNAGASASDLKNAGFSLSELKSNGFTAGQLRSAGFTASELRGAGFTANELRGAGISVQDLVAAGFTDQQLKEAGFTAIELKQAGRTASQLKAIGFTVGELRNSGFSASDLKRAGFSGQELRQGGFNARDLQTAGFGFAEIKAAGFNANEFKNAGFTVADMRRAGFTIDELVQAGISINELKSAGVGLLELKNAGVSAKDLKNAGFSESQLRAVGFTDAEIAAGGQTVQELLASGLTPKQIVDQNKATVSDLINAGVTVRELKNSGIPADQLIAANVSVADLVNSGYTPQELLAAGASVEDLKAAGVPDDQLIGANANVQELLAQGFTVSQLKTAGFTAEQLIEGGVPVADLRQAGFTVDELVAGGAPADQLLNEGLSAKQLIDAGMSAGTLVQAGVPTSQLVAAGADTGQLLQAGVAPKDLLDLGVPATDLVAGGASTSSLLQAGLSPEELLGAGATPRDLIAGGASATALFNAGVPVNELVTAGASTSELVTAGASARSLLDAGVSVSELKAAGVSATNLFSAGVSEQDLKSAGFTDAEIAEAKGDDGTGSGGGGGTIDDLIESQLAAKLLKDGDECIQQTSSNQEANACRAKGRFWSCEINICYTEEFRRELITEGLQCIEKNSDVAEQDSCLADVRGRAAGRIAGGELCEDGPEKTACLQEGKIYNCNVGLCLTQGQNNDVKQKMEICFRKDDEAERNQCVADAEVQTTQDLLLLCTGPKERSCNAQPDKQFNCLADTCLDKAFNQEVVNDAKSCVANNKDSEIRKVCLDEVKKKITNHIASGASCDQNAPEAASCSASGKIYNCQVGLCLTSSQNQKVVDKANACLAKPESQQDACLKQAKVDLTEDILFGCANEVPAAATCNSQSGRSYNCVAEQCLTDELNQEALAKSQICVRENDDTEALNQCLDRVKSDLTKKVAAGAGCDPNTEEARQCSAEGKVYNCLAEFCLTRDQNEELASRIVQCQEQSVNSQENQECLANLKTELVGRVARGEFCDNNTSEAQECQAEGKVFNCNANVCLTEEQNNLLADKITDCELNSPNETAKKECFDDIKREVVFDVASGKFCENSSPEALACQAEGKVFNCNVNFCLTEEQNTALAEEVVKCQLKESQAAIDQCMADLEENAVGFLVTACKPTPAKVACEKKGKVFNCIAGLCLSKSDNQRFVNAIKRCNAQPTEADKKKCFDELKELAEIAKSNDGKLTSDKLKMPNNPASGIHAMIALISGGIGLAAGCVYSGIAGVAAGAYASINESNTDSEAKEELGKLRREFQALEQRLKTEDPSFELQIEAFEFYERALKKGEEIAKKKGQGYELVQGMYALSGALAVVDAMTPPGPSCPQQVGVCKPWCFANVAAAGLGIATTVAVQNETKKAAKKLADGRKKVQEIKEKFLKHFGDPTGLESDSGLAGGGGSGSGDSGGTGSGSENGGTGPGVQTVAGGGGSGGSGSGVVNPATGNEFEGSTETTRSCMDATGKIDPGCACRENNSCFSLGGGSGSLVNTGSANTFDTTVNNLGATGLVSDANRVFAGEISSSDLPSSNVIKQTRDIKSRAENVVGQVNTELAKQGKAPLSLSATAADIDAAVAKNVKRSDIDKVASNSALNNFDAKKFQPSSKSLQDALAELENNTKDSDRASGLLPANFDPSQFVLANDFELDRSIGSASKSNFNGSNRRRASGASADPYEYNSAEQILEDESASIFQLISNRYNKLRMQKRFGTR